MHILALDLGTKCGWAQSFGGVRESGTQILAKAKELKDDKAGGFNRNGDMRFYRLMNFLDGKIVECLRSTHAPIDFVIYEDVQFSTYTLQTQLWSSLRTAIWAKFPPHHHPQVVGMPVASLKVFGAHHGGATKPMMAAWLLKKHPELFRKPQVVTAKRLLVTKCGRDVDDNEIDACHLLDWGLETFK